jgi:hypothetical protein
LLIAGAFGIWAGCEKGAMEKLVGYGDKLVHQQEMMKIARPRPDFRT